MQFVIHTNTIVNMTDSPFKTSFESIAEMYAYIGKEVGLSNWLTINQESINQFARLTKDEQWIHTDPDKSAKFSPFKKTIAHGFLVLSFCSHFAEQCFILKAL